jgi:hypothetical protein
MSQYPVASTQLSVAALADSVNKAAHVLKTTPASFFNFFMLFMYVSFHASGSCHEITDVLPAVPCREVRVLCFLILLK